MAFNLKDIQVFRPPCDATSEMVNVKAFLDRDLSDLLSYVKGSLGGVRYFPKGEFIKFLFKGHPVTVDRDCVAIAGFPDDASAVECAREVVSLLDDIDARKDSIVPDATPFDPPSVMDVLRLLPKKAGCGRCGLPTCMAFAAALVKGEAAVGMCPDIREEDRSRLKEILGER